MKKLFQRLLVFFVGVPLAGIAVAGLPQKNHLTVNIVIILLSAVGALEFAAMIKKRSRVSLVESAVLGCLAPLSMTLIVSFGADWLLFPAVLTAGASWTLARRAFVSEAGLAEGAGFPTGGLSALFYPGLFMSWLVRMGLFDNASVVMLVFLATVILNDSAAWLAGVLFGKGNRGIVPASPNKSVAGFAGGFAASALAGFGAAHFFPAVFPSRPAGLVLGCLTGIAAAVGDLAESAVKRSAGIKDSGSIIPGRGGVLDSIDSIALAAPVFYGLYRLLFV